METDIFDLGAYPADAPQEDELLDGGIYFEDGILLDQEQEVVEYVPYDYSGYFDVINDNFDSLLTSCSLLHEDISQLSSISSSILLFVIFYVCLYVGRGFANSLRRRGL